MSKLTDIDQTMSRHVEASGKSSLYVLRLYVLRSDFAAVSGESRRDSERHVSAKLEIALLEM